MSVGSWWFSVVANGILCFAALNAGGGCYDADETAKVIGAKLTVRRHNLLESLISSVLINITVFDNRFSSSSARLS